MNKKSEPVLQMRGISKHFGGIQALQNIDLDLYQGEILGLVGDNGAGKSTLIKIATGVYTPDSGEIFVRGKKTKIDNPIKARHMGIQVVHQTMALIDELNAWQNFFLCTEPYTPLIKGFLCVLKNKFMRSETERVLAEKLNISIPDLDLPVYYRSGGQKQAIAIGRAVYQQNINTLILDEPTAALGPEESERTLQLVRTLRDQGIGIIIITHNIDQVMYFADRIMVLWRGQHVGTCNPKEVSKNHIIHLIMGSKEVVTNTKNNN